MLNAIATAHWRNGFWNQNRGYEYNLLVWAAAVAVAATGGARLSLDALVGWDDNLRGVWLAAAVVIGGAVVSAATLLVGRSHDRSAPTASERSPIRRAA